MSNSPVNLGAAHVACLNEAIRQAPLIVERWRSGVFDVLNERYTSSMQNIEKRHLDAAMLALHNYQADIRKNFVAALTNAIANEAQTPRGTEAEKSRVFIGSVNFDDLELMGDSAVQDTVDSARVLQTVAIVCEAGLAAFSARLSTAQGFEQVKTEMNPLRPEIFSRSLLAAVQSIPVDNALRSLWFTHGGLLLGQLVQGLYLALNELLTKRGIEPAAYRVITKRGFKIAGQSNYSGPGGATGFDDLASSAFAPLAKLSGELPTISFPQTEAKRNNPPVAAPSRTQLTVDRSRRLLVGDDDASLQKQALPTDSEPSAHQDFPHPVPVAVTVLNAWEKNGKGTSQVQRKAPRTQPLPLTQLREQLKLDAKSLGQSRAIDAVSLLIEKMANDPRLLAPVQQVIANAEPAFLRLAFTAPRFFSDKSHPARRLLETIASKSLAFATEGAPGFAEFLRDLQGVAGLLAAGGANDTQHFANVLSDFEEKSALRHAAEYENRRGTTQALLEVEQRNILALKISTEILARTDFVLANQTIAAFLTGPWSQVLAKERLAVESDRTGVHKAIFSLTLGELLWSLDAKQTSSHPKRLAKLIPSILERLQGGLLSLDSPLADSRAFFEELSTIHQSSLNASGVPVPSNATPATPVRNRKTKMELDGLFGAGDSAHGLGSGLAPLEAQRSSSIKDVLPGAEPRFQNTQPFFDTAPGEKPALEPKERVSGSIELQLGAWVDLLADDEWFRAQLNWISRYRTLFMFTSPGGRTHSMTEPLLHYFLLQGLVKVISQEGVLDGVKLAARRNSTFGDGQAGKKSSRF